MKTIKLFALLAAILTLAACDKENGNHERDIVYTVDEQAATTVHLTTEEEFDALLDQFCDYARSGSVTFRNPNRTCNVSKEATTFHTTDREAMKRWMRRMENEGRTVTVTYNVHTGTWHGTAYALPPREK